MCGVRVRKSLVTALLAHKSDFIHLTRTPVPSLRPNSVKSESELSARALYCFDSGRKEVPAVFRGVVL